MFSTVRSLNSLGSSVTAANELDLTASSPSLSALTSSNGLFDLSQQGSISRSSASIDGISQASQGLAVIELPQITFTPPDNTLATAQNLGTLLGTLSAAGYVGDSDLVDHYQFTLNNSSPFNLALTGMGANADVRLIRDDNNNGTVEIGEVIASSSRLNNSDEAINLANLAVGTYIIQINRDAGNTSYKLQLSDSTTSNLLSTERDIGTLNGTHAYSGSLSAADTADVYQFSVTNVTLPSSSGLPIVLPTYVNITLSGLSNNANVRLIRDVNQNGLVEAEDVIERSFNAGSVAEWISGSLLTGTYLVQVSRVSGDTNYHLSVSTGDWYSTNLSDPGIIGEARFAARDGQISRNDVINILQETRDYDTITATELNDLQMLHRDRGNLMPEYVRVLTNKVINGDLANSNSGIGNLLANSPATRMESLIGKWFLGSDRPNASGTYRYVSGSLFQNGIRYSDVDQGGVGDCYFLSAVAATTYRTPNAISEMFIDNGDGTFTVRFFNNGVADYLTVDRYLPSSSSNNSIYSGWGGGSYNESNNELWVALLEKAYAQLNESGWIGQDATNSYSGISGGSSNLSLSHITGQTVLSNTLDATDIPSIISAINSGSIMTTGTRGSDAVDSSIPGIVGTHSYAVLGYNASTQRFRLYNPYAGNYGGAPGIVELTHNQFLANFNVWRVVSS